MAASLCHVRFEKRGPRCHLLTWPPPQEVASPAQIWLIPFITTDSFQVGPKGFPYEPFWQQEADGGSCLVSKKRQNDSRCPRRGNEGPVVITVIKGGWTRVDERCCWPGPRTKVRASRKIADLE